MGIANEAFAKPGEKSTNNPTHEGQKRASPDLEDRRGDKSVEVHQTPQRGPVRDAMR